MINIGIYDFVMRGLLTEEALDRAGRPRKPHEGLFDPRIAKTLSIDKYDDVYIASAVKMAAVFVAITLFENGVRKLIADVFEQNHGPDWWETCAGERIRKQADARMKEDAAIRWHTSRGSSPIYYTDMEDLRKMILPYWPLFEPLMFDYEWVSSTLKVIEKSRNVIMHSGEISNDDIRRIGYYIRDWIAQVEA